MGFGDLLGDHRQLFYKTPCKINCLKRFAGGEGGIRTRDSVAGILTEAIEVARTQSALAFELRSAIDLARLLSDGEQRDQARHSLALVYDRFTEGFQTADLKMARGLLENLQP
jgi:hypothetical protein